MTILGRARHFAEDLAIATYVLATNA